MYAPIVLFLILIVLLVAAVLAFTQMSKRRQARTTQLAEGAGPPCLRYRVPTGVDHAMVVTSLENEGYAATSDTSGTHREVLIPCPMGVDRERARVRATIHHVRNPEGDEFGVEDVRFADEEQTGPSGRG